MQAWVVGPGLGTGQPGRDRPGRVLADGVPTCVDADGITLLAGTPTCGRREPDAPVVLTPHDREFARIAGEVGPDRVAAARRAAGELSVRCC